VAVKLTVRGAAPEVALSVAVTPNTVMASVAVTGGAGPEVAVTETVPVAPAVVPAVKVSEVPVVELRLPREAAVRLQV
jgi:hypothetical protein